MNEMKMKLCIGRWQNMYIRKIKIRKFKLQKNINWNSEITINNCYQCFFSAALPAATAAIRS